MNAAHFGRMVSVEFRKLLSRTLAQVGLGFATLVGFAAPVITVGLIYIAEMTMGPASSTDGLASQVVYGALWARNIFLIKVFMVTLTALIFASEWQSRTLREDMLRAVPRWSILLAKWLSLVGWSALSLALTFAASSIMSVVIWGFSGPWIPTFIGYGMCIATDAAFLALALLVAVLTRSVPATIAGMFIAYAFDWIVGMYLAYGPFMPRQLKPYTDDIQPWLPSAAFDFWNTFATWAAADPASGVEIAFPLFTLISFCAILFGCLGAAVAAFQRIDVP